MRDKVRICLVTFSVAVMGMTLAQAQTQPYTPSTAPWSQEEMEICKPAMDEVLRPVVFEPMYSTKTKVTIVTEAATTEMVFVPEKTMEDGTIIPSYFKERVIVDATMSKMKTYRYLEKQYIGYLNAQDEWVDVHGEPVKNIVNFRTETGAEQLPTPILVKTEIFPSKKNLSEGDIAALMARLRKSPPCTFFFMPDYSTIIEHTRRDTGKNAHYVCKPEGGIDRYISDGVYKNYGRDVVTRPDGDTYAYIDKDGVLHPKSNQGFYAARLETHHDNASCQWTEIKR